jgi:hypothetical protein
MTYFPQALWYEKISISNSNFFLEITIKQRSQQAMANYPGQLHQNLAWFLILNKSIGYKYRFKNKH